MLMVELPIRQMACGFVVLRLYTLPDVVDQIIMLRYAGPNVNEELGVESYFW